MNRTHYNQLLRAYNGLIAHHIMEDILTLDPLTIADGGHEDAALGLSGHLLLQRFLFPT